MAGGWLVGAGQDEWKGQGGEVGEFGVERWERSRWRGGRGRGGEVGEFGMERWGRSGRRGRRGLG